MLDHASRLPTHWPLVARWILSDQCLTLLRFHELLACIDLSVRIQQGRIGDHLWLRSSHLLPGVYSFAQTSDCWVCICVQPCVLTGKRCWCNIRGNVCFVCVHWQASVCSESLTPAAPFFGAPSRVYYHFSWERTQFEKRRRVSNGSRNINLLSVPVSYGLLCPIFFCVNVYDLVIYIEQDFCDTCYFNLCYLDKSRVWFVVN